MDIYDTRRDNLQILIRQLKMSHAAFGSVVGYNGQYIGQLLNRTKRSSGGQAIVTDKVITKILAKLKSRAPDLTREWFDKPRIGTLPVPPPLPTTASRLVDLAGAPTPEAPLVDDDRFPAHLSSTWPYMSEEQRAALRYLEAGFRAQRKTK